MAGITLEELMKKRFLFEGREVRLTGRYAKKKIGRKDQLIFEIRSADMNATSEKKWTRLDDMYEILHPLAHRVEFAEDLMDAVRRVAEKNKTDK